AALTTKAAAAPAAATIAPPIAGPRLRAMLNPIELSATAPGNVARGTMSPTEACHAGPFSAAPQPLRNEKPTSSHGVIHPAKAKMASVTDTNSMKPWAASITRLRSRLSATAPDQRDKSRIGSAVDA